MSCRSRLVSCRRPTRCTACRRETIKAVAQRWGVNEKLYRQLKAKMAVHGTLEARKKGRVGRKKKVTGALYDSFVIVNRDARGDKTRSSSRR